MDRPPLQAVVFDMDDTLFAERDYVRSGYRAVGRYLRDSLGRAEPLDEWLWNRFLAGQSAGAMGALNAEFRLGLSPAQVQELVEVYRRHRPEISPLPGLPELLGRLHETRKLALLSDGYLPTQQLKFEALNLGRFFDEVLFTESLGRDAWKPSPKGFEWLHNKLGVPHGSLAYVADNAGKDFIAPNQLGWRTVRYVFPGQLYRALPADRAALPQFTATSPQELLNALR